MGLDYRSFNDSLNGTIPPRGIESLLAALWWAKKGDWDKAHRLVMDEASAEAAWVHAFLHRTEGDESNANYWYAKAGRQPRVATSTRNGKRSPRRYSRTVNWPRQRSAGDRDRC